MELIQFGIFPWVFYVCLFFSYSLNIFSLLIGPGHDRHMRIYEEDGIT